MLYSFLCYASLAQNSLQPDTGIKTLIEINMFIVDPQVFVTSSCLHIHHILAKYLPPMKSVMCRAGCKIYQTQFDS